MIPGFLLLSAVPFAPTGFVPGEPAKAERRAVARAFSPETTGYTITYSSAFDDGYLVLFRYYPLDCAVRFAIPVYGGDNSVQLNAVIMSLYLNFVAYPQVFSDEFRIYSDGPGGQEPGSLLYTVSYSFEQDTLWPGVWILVLDSMQDLDIVIPGGTDSVSFWFEQENIVSADSVDSLIRTADTTEADNFTYGYNFVDYQDQGWVDLYSWGFGNDFAVKLFYTPMTSGVEEGPATIPGIPGLFPNPARDRAMLRLFVAEAGDVEVSLYDPAGRLAMTAFSGTLGSGIHDLPLELSGLARGVYLASVRVGNTRQAKVLTIR